MRDSAVVLLPAHRLNRETRRGVGGSMAARPRIAHTVRAQADHHAGNQDTGGLHTDTALRPETLYSGDSRRPQPEASGGLSMEGFQTGWSHRWLSELTDVAV